jgi:myo-inositol-1(or 4)-monophosphatase
LTTLLKMARTVAVEAAREAGRIAKNAFQQNDFLVYAKGDQGDVVTEVDWRAERAIVDMIRNHFPDHVIQSEEMGTSGGESEWMWQIDPLDGTNNFAIGLPLYGVSITLCHLERPVLGVIVDSHQERVYIAERGRGAVCGTQPLRVCKRGDDPNRMTVSWIQGYHVGRKAGAMRLKQMLDNRFRRTLRLWAPTLAWAMLARGDLDAVFVYDSEGEDLNAGLLLAREAGATVLDFSGRQWDGTPGRRCFLACHPDHADLLLSWIREAEGETADTFGGEQ